MSIPISIHTYILIFYTFIVLSLKIKNTNNYININYITYVIYIIYHIYTFSTIEGPM